jgi:hypothetical protein
MWKIPFGDYRLKNERECENICREIWRENKWYSVFQPLLADT